MKNTMKLKIVSAMMVLAGVMSAKADLLYWQLGGNTAASAFDYAYASIYSVSGDGTKNLLKNVGLDNNGRFEGNTIAKDSAVVAAQFTPGAAASSFFIELYDSNMNLIAESNGNTAASDLTSYISAVEFSQSWNAANVWGGSAAFKAASAVPEPTSGLLLLLGAAMMGLRRKRA